MLLKKQIGFVCVSKNSDFWMVRQKKLKTMNKSNKNVEKTRKIKLNQEMLNMKPVECDKNKISAKTFFDTLKIIFEKQIFFKLKLESTFAIYNGKYAINLSR